MGPSLREVVAAPVPSPSEGEASGTFYSMAWCIWQDMPKAVQMAHALGEIMPGSLCSVEVILKNCPFSVLGRVPSRKNKACC